MTKMLPDHILFTTQSGNEIASRVTDSYEKIAVLVDENTRLACYPRIQSQLPFHHLIEIPSGEENKTLPSCQKIWEAMTTLEMDRHSLLIIIGGGVLGDMGGFCAATFKRGIDFMLVPTTLLSQVDASIGGKLGIDFNHYKNHIGVFQQPIATVVDVSFLKTLSTRELRSGYAEVLKHALIRDESMWNDLKAKPMEEQDWEVLVRQNVAIKSTITEEDPKEKGVRKLLNFGHTIGHAIESHFLKKTKILHGEAIAAGMIAEAWISRTRSMLSQHAFDEIREVILSAYGKIAIAEDEIESITALTLQDKKNQGNRILCVLPTKIGEAQIDCEISPDEVKNSIQYYLNC